MRFEDLRLTEPILRAVSTEGYTIPTAIQVAAIPHVLEGHDLLGCAQTGTGKTAAFALPILHRLIQSRPARHDPSTNSGSPRATSRGDRRTGGTIRVLILAPTRELAAQIEGSFRNYGRHTPLRYAVIYGGISQNPQARALRDGVDILVATPGRLLDLMEQGLVDLRGVEVLVLDEADRMLDMGFIRDIRKIVAKVPTQRQTLLFSATIPSDIRELASAILRNPVTVNVAPAAVAADTVEQVVYFVEKREKPAMLEHVLNANAITRALVFTRTKHGADRVARHLSRAGIEAEAIHGNKSQNARDRAMKRFKSQAPPVLVATDIAARGLDIDDVSHVINYDVPNVPETYVHRIGRTGRAGASGLALSLCDGQEREYLQDIERLIRKRIPVCRDMPKPSAAGRLARRGHTDREADTGFRRASGPRPAMKTQHSQPPRPSSRRQHAAVGQQTGTAMGTAQPQRHITVSSDDAQAQPAGVGYRSRGRSRPRRGGMRKRR